MPRLDADQELIPSVLDRLIDQEPRVSTEAVAHRGRRLAELKESVKRDLEWLLNARRLVIDIPPAMTQARESLLTFGLPDFTHNSLSMIDDQDGLRHVIEQTIRRFEPRLDQVHVTLVAGREFERSVRFRIDAALRVKPSPEPVTFDSVLQLSTKAFVVEGS